MTSHNTPQSTELAEFACFCREEKKFQIIFDGADSGKYIVEYCQKCYDKDDKQFMISTEVIG
ncbi:MAG: hypothetical protein COA77_07280 [Thaumarchaeota archaeon]|nr:MAG: hypothetical protein COA77_07280 [Nitrososphaerota archaeon]